MRKSILFVVLSLPFAADMSLAQSNAMDIYCGACRDPVEHPRDYINFAFNQTYGPDAWLSFDQADDFADGRALVQTGERWGFINAAGEMVIPPMFERARTFSNGLAYVTLDGRPGYIDTDGAFVWRQGE